MAQAALLRLPAVRLWQAAFAPATLQGYAALLAPFLEWCQSQGHWPAQGHVVGQYALMMRDTGRWASRTAAAALTNIPSALLALARMRTEWGQGEGLLVPLSRKQLKLALQRGRRDARVEHRKGLPREAALNAARALAAGRGEHHPMPWLAAVLMLGFAAMLRSLAIQNLQANEVSWEGMPTGFIVTRVSKTRAVPERRGQWAPTSKEEMAWARALVIELQRRVRAGSDDTALLSARHRGLMMRRVREAAPHRTDGKRWTLANIRAGGHAFWTGAGMPGTLRHTSGSWSQKSKIPEKNYLKLGKVTGRLMRQLTRRAQQAASDEDLGSEGSSSEEDGAAPS